MMLLKVDFKANTTIGTKLTITQGAIDLKKFYVRSFASIIIMKSRFVYIRRAWAKPMTDHIAL